MYVILMEEVVISVIEILLVGMVYLRVAKSVMIVIHLMAMGVMHYVQSKFLFRTLCGNVQILRISMKKSVTQNVLQVHVNIDHWKKEISMVVSSAFL